jgi:twitching motility protein PilT
MQNEILWLVRLCIDQGLINPIQALAVRAAVGDSAELMDFAQQLIDDGYIEDHALLEKIAGLALVKGRAGPPADNPFASAPPRPALSSASAPALTLFSSLAIPNGTAPPFMSAGEDSGPPQVPSIPFETIYAMDELAVADAMRELLLGCARYGASDLHVSAGTRPFIRMQRAIKQLSTHVLSPDDARRLNLALLTSAQHESFERIHDFDYALAIDASNRYRVNLMVHKAGISGSYRMVPSTIPQLDQLGLRNVDAVRKLLNYHNGLILVTGPVGSGKTTTLAALVADLNEKREDHIITVEDPVEVVQPAKGCNITQREVGAHTASFASALKGALREDPDVIIIGELRDLETIEMAITASETGHLVIGTMHTSDAATTLNRLLDVFPPSQQTQIRASVAESLRGILCQRLLPATDGGLVLATELMVANTAVSALIRDGKTQGLRNVIETGVREGMCLMENVVFELYTQDRITAETARQNVTSRMLKAKIT